ncbi:MAG: acyltransferase [bacterium]
MTQGTQRWHLGQLDSLRFFSYVAVFICHTFALTPASYIKYGLPEAVSTSLLPRIVTAGMYGVDMFFVLSSYLITKLILQETDVFGILNVKQFYIRRALRIWPLYFLFIGVCVALGPKLIGFRPGAKEILALSSMSANWLVVFGSSTGMATGVLWSISVEEQFYVLWPLIVRRIKVANLWKFALGMIVFSLAARAILFTMHQSFDSIWCNTFARLDPIAMGILLATRGSNSILRLPLWSIWMSLVLIILSQRYLPVDVNNTLAEATLGYLLPAICCAMILQAFISKEADRGTLSRVTEYLGRISYGLYIWHGAMIDFWSSRTHSTPKLIVLSFGSAIILAVISYHCYEKFFLSLKGRFYPGAEIIKTNQ